MIRQQQQGEQIGSRAEPQGSPRTLEQAAMPCSSGPSPPRDRTQVSRTAGGFFTNWVIREALNKHSVSSKAFPSFIKYDHVISFNQFMLWVIDMYLFLLLKFVCVSSVLKSYFNSFGLSLLSPWDHKESDTTEPLSLSNAGYIAKTEKTWQRQNISLRR